MVQTEIVASDDSSYWMGNWEKASIEQAYKTEEGIYFRSKDEEELIERAFDFLEIKNPSYSDSYLEELATEEVENYKWEKVIVVYIGLPEY